MRIKDTRRDGVELYFSDQFNYYGTRLVDTDKDGKADVYASDPFCLRPPMFLHIRKPVTEAEQHIFAEATRDFYQRK